jgi:predicted nucleic acid-binding protein
VALILDTNALSAVAEGQAAATQLVARAASVAVPVIVLGEYRLGIAQFRHKTAYESWLQEWIGAISVLNIDEATTSSYASIGLELKAKGKPIPTNDLWIAALCRQHSLPLLSQDRHFDLVAGLQRLSW